MVKERSNPLVEAVLTDALRIGLFVASLSGATATAADHSYTSLGNDRVLLMNSDKRSDGAILYQGYNDTSKTRAYYWGHTSEDKVGDGLKGLTHTYTRKSDKTVLWYLTNCRAGSGTYQTKDTYNYIPYGNTALTIGSSYSTTAKAATKDADIGTVCMTPVEGACVYSPYCESVGTIYFDAVNAMTAFCHDSIELQIATNVLDAAGTALSANTTDYSNFVWTNCPVTVSEVLNGTTVNTLTDDVETVAMDVTTGRKTKFYRMRATLNYRGPIRFRILRHGGGTYYSGATRKTIDNAASADGWILVDNIMASYPPMKVAVTVGGERVTREKARKEGETASSGTYDIGWTGFFTEAFLSRGLENVYGVARLSFESNGLPASVLKAYDISPRLHWRIRYLNQVVPAWNETAMTLGDGDVIRTATALPVTAAGDLEYYVGGSADTPYFKGLDYAFNAGAGLGFGTTEPGGSTAFTEAFPEILNGHLPSAEAAAGLPSGGTERFARIREAVAIHTRAQLDYAFFDSADTMRSAGSNRVEAVLSADNTWRAYVPTPKTTAGQVLTFRFTAFDPAVTNEATGGTVLSYATNVWYGTEDKTVAAEDLPYYGKVGATDLGMRVSVDAKAGYLVFEVNESSGVLSVSHGDYQDFNTWTDALGDTFVGDYTSTTGVARTKAEHSAWQEYLNGLSLSMPRNVLWQEDFDAYMDSKGTHAPYYFDVPFTDMSTPNGWAAQYGRWVNGGYPDVTNKVRGMALQMEGRGKGSLSLVTLTPPEGVGEVSFKTRLAQTADFENFAYYYNGLGFTNYTVAARATMTVLANGSGVDFTPSAAPSLSLVAYYRPNAGCYELRITRWKESAVVADLYKWTFDKTNNVYSATLLSGSHRLLSANGYLFAPPVSTTTAGRTVNRGAFYLTAFSNASGSTTLRYGISSAFSDAALSSCSFATQVTVTDSSKPLTRGAYGVGSTGCISVFNQISATPNNTIKAASEPKLSSLVEERAHFEQGDWEERRWAFNGSFSTYDRLKWALELIPPSQSVSLALSQWTDTGTVSWETPVSTLTLTTFATTNVTFAPHTVNNYNLKLQAGGSSADRQCIDVVVDTVEATQWRGQPSVKSAEAAWSETNGWARTYAWLTAAGDATATSGGGDEFATISGTYSRATEGTGASAVYVYTFSPGSATFTAKTSADLTEIRYAGGGGTTNVYSDTLSVVAGDVLTLSVGEATTTSANGGNTTVTLKSGSATKLNKTGSGGKVKNCPGVVIVRVKPRSRYCLFQPMRGEVVGTRIYPMSLRSPYLDGFSMATLSWVNADEHAVLHLQMVTNGINPTTVRDLTLEDPGAVAKWEDVNRFGFDGVIAFSNMTAAARASGSTNVYIGLRAPVRGLLRVAVDPSVIQTARAHPTDYSANWGAVTLTGFSIWDEPELDADCWWGWNLLTSAAAMRRYLYDQDGNTCALNFSGKEGTGEDDPLFRDKDATAQYEQEDPFVQAPTIEKGIGTVRFEARTWTNEPACAYVSLYGATDPLAPYGQWKRLAEIAVTSTVFETYTWKTNTTSSEYTSLRLTVRGAKDGRGKKAADASYPNAETQNKHQRVMLKNISIVQPVLPQVRCVGAYPFRGEYSSTTNLRNIASDRMQPILDEMFGFQTTVEPVSLEKELNRDSISVKVYWYAGKSPWGWRNWKDLAVAKGQVGTLSRCTDDAMTFRSTTDDPKSFAIVKSADLDGESSATVQYHFEVTYESTSRDGGTTTSTHDLTEGEWSRPSWFDPLDYNLSLGGGAADRFSAYTILDVVQPHCAWVNEINLWNGVYQSRTFGNNGENGDSQFVELAIPQGYDLNGWYLQVACNDSSYATSAFATLGGTGGDGKTITSCIKAGASCTNGFAFLTLQSPAAAGKGGILTGGTTRVSANGTWKSFTRDEHVINGTICLREGVLMQLKRPSGILEHQFVFMSTNTSNSRVAHSYDGTNVCQKFIASGAFTNVFFAGEDKGAGSLGVVKSHGETGIWPAPTHTPETTVWAYGERPTPGTINAGQTIDADQFVPPAGDQLWLYASVGEHVRQYLDDGTVVTATNGPATLISFAKGTGASRAYVTNLVYAVDRWFEADSVTYKRMDGTVVKDRSSEFVHKGQGTGTFTVDVYVTTNDALKSYNNRLYLNVTAKQDEQYLLDADGKPYIAPTDPYYDAVMSWLQNYEYGPILLSKYLSIGGYDWGLLTLKEMYWLDIPPTNPDRPKAKGGTNDWALAGGIGYFNGTKGTECIKTVETEDGTNVVFAVSLAITNTFTGAAHAPQTLNGLAAGSTSSNAASGWTGPTFKIKAALQNGKVNNIYTPLRWFTFGPDSFDEDFAARIEVTDPFSRHSPAYAQGWDKYRELGYTGTIFWKWALDEDIGAYQPAMLNSNSTWTVTH